jgi:DNA ligase (NAD+)
MNEKTINWTYIKENPHLFLKKLTSTGESTSTSNTITILENIINKADFAYFKNDPLLPDPIYDLFIDKLKHIDPDNKLLKTVGLKEINNKTKLPIFMGSMNKIKTKPELNTWINKFNSVPIQDFVISEKLDGISVLIVINKGKINLYTRGDGEYGRDISFLIKFNEDLTKFIKTYVNKFKQSKQDRIILRGEIIISKSNFTNYLKNPTKMNYTSARSMVNGLISMKEYDQLINLLDIVIYELIEPILTPENQFKFILDNCSGLKIAQNRIIALKNIVIWESISNNYLLNTLSLFKKNSKYEIDGIIITHNNIYKREKSNPKHSIAFKSNDEGKVTVVKNVKWEVSKYNILIPRIHFNKIIIKSSIEYCSGFSAKYIFNNCIGPGTKIRVILSGDVIPFICDIIEPTYPQMPSINYKWNERHIHIYSLEDTKNNDSLNKKKIHHFIKTINIENVSVGLINKLYDNGYNSLKKILTINITQLLNCNGIKETLANKIYNSIHNIIEKPLYLGLLMAGSLKFNSGIGIKKIDKILEKYPDILTKHYTVDNLNMIEGLQTKTTQQFLENLEHFKIFLEEIDFINYYSKNSNSSKHINPFIKDKKFVLTGFRDSKIMGYIGYNNGIIQNNVNSKTDYLIIKNKETLSTLSTKIENAKKLKIKIITIDEFNGLMIDY